MTLIYNNVKNIISVSILAFILFGIQSIAYSKENEIKYKKSIIYYTNPYREFYAPFDRQQLFLRSRHKLMVGNKMILDGLAGILLDTTNEEKNSKKEKLGYFFYGKIFLNAGGYYEFYLDRNMDFEMESSKGTVITGRLKEKQFKQLVNLCEEIVDIVDVDYQWRKMTD